MKKPFIGARATPFPKNSSVSNVFKHEERQNTKKDIFDLHPLREGSKELLNTLPLRRKCLKIFRHLSVAPTHTYISYYM